MNKNETKNYLLTVKRKYYEIESQKDKILSLRNSLGPRAVRYDVESLGGSGCDDRMTKITIKVEEEEKILKQMELDYIILRMEVLDQIYQLTDTTLILLLKAIYLDFKSLKETSVIIDKSYDYTVELHQKALNRLSHIIPFESH